jgi:aryl-alcohol dehydrogenase-like predicted oxidoreductase
MEGLEWLKERNLTPERLEKVHALQSIAQDLSVSLPQLAIGWCLKNIHVSTVILGASRVEQLEETLKSLEVVPQLNEHVMNNIETILDNKPVQPDY